MKVYLVGIGMGNPATATVEAVRAIESSDVLIGAERMLDAFPAAAARRLALVRADDIVAALRGLRAEAAGERRDEGGADGAANRTTPVDTAAGAPAATEPAQAAEPVVSVLFSGDVGFYSGASLLYGRLDDFDVTVVPGVSSLVYLCAKARTPWHDAFAVSAHGRRGDVAGAAQCHAKTFAITGGAVKVQDVCAALVERGLGDARVVAGERLSYPDERIVDATAAELSGARFGDLAALLVFNDRPVARPYAAPALADADFERGRAPMTKEEVRALAIAKLRIGPASVVWDVGAGTGSVSVEAALACPAGRVFAVERDPGACALIEKNRQRHAARNLSVVAGAAPEALAGLPAPDRVFIGGSGGALGAIVRVALAANPQARIALTAVTLETLAEALRVFDACGLPTDDIVQVSVARSRQAGRYHLMQAQNPVYLIVGEAAQA